MKQLNLIFLGILFSAVTLLANGTEHLASGKIGNVNYYVVRSEAPLQNELIVEIPYSVKIALVPIENGGSKKGYYASVSGQQDFENERTEIAALKERFAGYEIRYSAPSKFVSINVDLGIKRPMNYIVPPSGASFFSGNLRLSNEEGDAVLKNIREGISPIVEISVTAKIPKVSVKEEYALKLSEICESIEKQMGGSNQLTQAVLGLHQVLAKVDSDIKESSLKDQALKTSIASCLSFSSQNPIHSISDLLNSPVGINRPTEGTIQKLVVTQISVVPQSKPWPVETKVVTK